MGFEDKIIEQLIVEAYTKRIKDWNDKCDLYLKYNIKLINYLITKNIFLNFIQYYYYIIINILSYHYYFY